MPKLTFYPLGNADCCRVDLSNGKKLLFDYAATRNPEDPKDLRADLPTKLRDDLKSASKNHYEVVAFTHLDKDHFQGASEFFWLEHSAQFQGKDRIKINTMWVPAAMITEERVKDDEGRIIQREARYRLKQGKNIRVFSRPERLRAWLKDNGIRLEDRIHLITDAGNTAPEVTMATDGVEFFVHSPFARRQNDNTLEDRNSDSLVFQATFECEGVKTKLFLGADAPHDVLTDIVNITEFHEKYERLEWDIFKLPHHCSFTSLSEEKGEDKTVPEPMVKRLFEHYSMQKGTIVSTSEPIPTKGSAADEDPQPPHRQAANYYKGLPKQIEFIVTMEHPTQSSPEELVIEIGSTKAKVIKRITAGVSVITSRPAPKAG